MTTSKFSEVQPLPSAQTIRGLNGLLFFISDVRHGIGPLIAIYLRISLNWGPEKIGMALAMPDLAAVIFQVPAGLLADASPYKRLLIGLPCLIIICGCLLILYSHLFSVIICTQFLMGIAIAIIAPAISAITLGLFGRQRLLKRVSQNEMWTHAGNVCTALTAGLAGYLLGNEWVFYVVILFGIASLTSLTRIRPREINYQIARELAAPDPTTGITPKPTPLLQLFKQRSILIYNLSLIIYYITNGAQMALVSQMLSAKYPHSAALFIAGCMMIAELTMIGIAYGMGTIAHHLGRKPLFLAAFTILPIRALLYTLTDDPFWLLSIQILDGTAAGILGVIGTLINSDLALGSGRFNFLQGSAALATSIGVFTSNVLAGFIVTAYGFEMGFLTLATVGLAGILFYSSLMPETKKASTAA